MIGFVVVGVGRDLTQARDAAVALAERFPERVAATAGVHPHDATSLDEAAHAELAALVRRPEVVAVGRDWPRLPLRPLAARRAAGHLRPPHRRALAREVQKPIVVHTREAAEDTLALLASEGARDVGGIIHCFSEDRPFAARAIDLGFDVSFSGIVTFKNARAIHEVASWAPLERVLVETDSPYLAPVPMRGKPCEPAYVAYTAAKVAELRGMDVVALAEATTANAERRFRRAFPRAAAAGSPSRGRASKIRGVEEVLRKSASTRRRTRVDVGGVDRSARRARRRFQRARDALARSPVRLVGAAAAAAGSGLGDDRRRAPPAIATGTTPPRIAPRTPRGSAAVLGRLADRAAPISPFGDGAESTRRSRRRRTSATGTSRFT